MGSTTGISWTDGTINFWKGCTKVSPACANCYMYRDAGKYGWEPTVVTRLKGIWTKLLDPKEFKPGGRYFVSSWTDFFHEAADPWRAEAWDLMRRRPDITYQILTKRPERILGNLPSDWPWPNVHMGFTAEDQKWFDIRAKFAEQIPAALWFVSCEPLLGRIDMCESLGIWWNQTTGQWVQERPSKIGWVITGGESGPKARPSHPDHFRSLRNQAKAAGVPFHFKQWGEWAPSNQVPSTPENGKRINHENRSVLVDRGRQQSVFKFGIRNTDRLLDGVLWDEMPA